MVPQLAGRKKTALKEAMVLSHALDACQMRQGTKTGAWITVFPSTVNVTDMGDQDWCDTFFLCYSVEPPDFPTHCDGCNAKFSVCPSLDCKKGGIIKNHHNNIRDEVADLTGKAF